MLTKETIIADILDMDFAPDIIPLFKAIGMHCLGCAAASNESIEEACMVHGVDPDEFLEAVNAVIAEVKS
jgi:hybrid cluster-associated redox disulfide protein